MLYKMLTYCSIIHYLNTLVLSPFTLRKFTPITSYTNCIVTIIISIKLWKHKSIFSSIT